MKSLAAAACLILCIPVLAQEPQPPRFRLGDVAAPRAYDVRLAIDPRESAFEGEIRIELTVNRATPVLWLNAEKLDVRHAEFAFGERRVPARVIGGHAHFVGFEIPGGFPAGDAAAKIGFRGALEGVATRGLFRQQEGGEWYAITQLEAMNARRVFPCFDEPGWKTPWRVAIDAPAADGVFANTPATTVAPLADRPGWRRHTFAPTRALPSYLVAFAVGPFDLVDGGKAGALPTALRYAVTKGRGADARFARLSTPRVLEIMEEYFGSPYPFEKLDSLTIPSAFGFGAMENVGLITYSSDILLAPPVHESLAFQRRYLSIAGHEIAHMWFGNLVTLAWWDDIWLNEAFATWMARKGLRIHRPDWAGGWRQGEGRRRALHADRLMSARRIANPVDSIADIYGAFDNITYSKGGEVLSMFESWIGPARFRSGVQAFLKAHAYGNATSADFYRAIGEASGRPDHVVAAFRSFVDQPGLPLIDVTVRCDALGATLELAQQRMIPLGTRGADAKWITPACFRYEAAGEQHQQCAEVSARQSVRLQHAKACPAWVAGNAGGAGHWVARHSRSGMKNLVAHAARLPEAEAVALSFDSALLAEAGLIARDEALAIADALLKHASLGVRQGAVEFLATQRDMWLDGAQRARVAAMARHHVLPMARDVGWIRRDGDSIANEDLRGALLPFAAQHAEAGDLRRQARELALRWLDDRGAVAGSALRSVLQGAARFADEATFTRMEEALLATRSRADRGELIGALAQVRAPALRERALALLLRVGDGGPLLDGREAFALLETAFLDDHNRSAAFDHLRSHWEALIAKLPAESASRLLRRLPGLCTPADRASFVGFLHDRVAAHPGAQQAYRQSLEAIDICIAVHARIGPTPRRPRG